MAVFSVKFGSRGRRWLLSMSYIMHWYSNKKLAATSQLYAVYLRLLTLIMSKCYSCLFAPPKEADLSVCFNRFPFSYLGLIRFGDCLGILLFP